MKSKRTKLTFKRAYTADSRATPTQTEDNIPTLTVMDQIEFDEILVEHATIPRMPVCSPEKPTKKAKSSRKTTKKAKKSSVLPGQQCLFNDLPEAEPKKEKMDTEAPKNTIKQQTDNPFLPSHIRERLHQNKHQELVNELHVLGQSLEKNRPIPVKSEKPEHQEATSGPAAPPVKSQPKEQLNEQLIDEVVKAYLPSIEQELKRRLMEKFSLNEQDKN